MAQLSPDYKQLFEEEQRKRQAAERAQEAAERKTRKTSLPEFLDACHIFLHSGLIVQTNPLFATKGYPDNATRKTRPERIVAWDDFTTSQEAIWKDLQQSTFMHERYFTSLHTLEESGETIRQRILGSELDLNHFERSTVEDHVTSIIKQLYSSPSLRARFGLKGSIRFENHANTLSSEQEIADYIHHLSISGRRRSPRLLTQLARPLELAASEPTAGAITEAAKAIRPRADQFCVYNISSGEDIECRVAAFIVEYKAPHKLHLGCIYEGLTDMNLEEVVCCHDTDGPQDHFRRLVAAAITQAFSYMVRAGLEYGYVCTGEAFIFLRVPDNPETVYYFLSVPEGDVGETTGLSPDPSGRNRLHLTAVGQVLAFTLQALKKPPRSQDWQANAVARLKTWEVVYEQLLDQISTDDIPSSEYRPSPHISLLRISPIQLRPRGAPNCRPPLAERQSSDDESGSDPETPSRIYRHFTTRPPAQAPDPVSTASSSPNTHYRSKNVQYCTQGCLRGLVDGSPLDQTCPNASCHGESHQINQPTFLNLIRQQLARTLDIDCKPVGVHGSRGALFTVRLTSHGYTVAAKGTTVDFVAYLKREAVIYERLRPIQGIHVPVYLGSVDLDRSYIYDGIAEIVHMMFISFGGQPIFRHINAVNRAYITQRVARSIQAIHQLGVVHRDAYARNILWNAQLGQTMVIDFERAEIHKPRAVLRAISPNRMSKRKTILKEQPDEVFTREARQVMTELRGA